MPWREVTPMSLREEFVSLATQPGANVSRLCRAFGISRKTGYKWIGRAARGAEGDDAWAADRSRRPLHSPGRCDDPTERAVLALRDKRSAWGGRKIRRVLQDNAHRPVPAASTITAILRRHDRLDPAVSAQHAPMQRFERDSPNELWQMDFKGPVPTARGPAHPLSVLDDHSRYALGIVVCPDQRAATVQRALEPIFCRYGLPQRMLMDNGSCWGRVDSAYTVLEVGLLRLGVAVTHGRPYHPQTQGKTERFHRTMRLEALGSTVFADLAHCQSVLDDFRHLYNHLRPHDALDLDTPASRYQPSHRSWSPPLPPIEYPPGDLIRRVGQAGFLSFRGQRFHVGRAFTGQPLALRPTTHHHLWTVHFLHHHVATLNLLDGSCTQIR
jgi:transposase InsO family protein